MFPVIFIFPGFDTECRGYRMESLFSPRFPEVDLSLHREGTTGVSCIVKDTSCRERADVFHEILNLFGKRGIIVASPE